MEFENEYLERLIRNFDGFSVEGFNLFALGDDHLPHLICACPNKDFARAICTLLEIAKKAQTLRALNAYVTSHCYLSPKILADGSLDLSNEALAKLDWVGISIHSKFQMTESEMTKRIVKAMSNPNVDCLLFSAPGRAHLLEGVSPLQA